MLTFLGLLLRLAVSLKSQQLFHSISLSPAQDSAPVKTTPHSTRTVKKGIKVWPEQHLRKIDVHFHFQTESSASIWLVGCNGGRRTLQFGTNGQRPPCYVVEAAHFLAHRCRRTRAGNERLGCIYRCCPSSLPLLLKYIYE